MARDLLPYPSRKFLAICLAAFPLAGCGAAVLDPAGPVAAGEKGILFDSLAIMLAIVVPTIIATLAFAWWFRGGNARARYDADWEYSGKIELVTWSVPVMVILFLGGVAWAGAHVYDPYRPLPSSVRPLEIRVVSLDWKWLFIYPEQGIATVNTLVLPAGRPVNFRVTSATVMNSFFVPRLGSQIYAMAGMTTRVSLQADRPGAFRGLSAHYSGDGFDKMHFTATALAPDAFGRWVAQAHSQRLVLDDHSYQALARQFVPKQPIVFGAVTPGLFERIATGRAPRAGVATARDGIAIETLN